MRLQSQRDCHSLITCFKLHVDYGIANPPTWEGSGAISPVMNVPFNMGTEVGESRQAGVYGWPFTHV